MCLMVKIAEIVRESQSGLAGLLITVIVSASSVITLHAAENQIRTKDFGDETFVSRLVFEDDFDDLDNWVVEGDGRVETRENQLVWDCFRKKQTAGTIWCRQPFRGPTIIEYDAVALDGQSNLNFIAYATHSPDGLLETSG